MKTFLVNPQCEKHPIPACWKCSVHAMLNGQDFERERIIALFSENDQLLYSVGEIIDLIKQDDKTSDDSESEETPQPEADSWEPNDDQDRGTTESSL